MTNAAEQFVASHTFTRQAADGSTVSWHQEDESAATNKAEAVGMVQRTIDFWVPKMASDIHRQRGTPIEAAESAARTVFRSQLANMLNEPFAKRWRLTMADFTIP